MTKHIKYNIYFEINEIKQFNKQTRDGTKLAFSICLKYKILETFRKSNSAHCQLMDNIPSQPGVAKCDFVCQG